jgi:succinate dehydrogenase / fumarate reductase cytochrome b subunit
MAHRSYRIASTYRTGSMAWLLHRLTGLLLVGYLYFHLIVLSSAVWPQGPIAFNRVVGLVTTPPFIVADLALFALIFYHALNGLRLMVLDLGWMMAHQQVLFWSSLILAALALALSAVWLIPYARL